MRLTVVGREIGVLPPVQEAGISEPTAAPVRRSRLLDALIALFEGCWGRATPPRVAEDGALTGGGAQVRPLNSDDLSLLSPLVAGVADKPIATQPGISRRTVRRRLSHTVEPAGAQTRMQPAWHAAGGRRL